MCIGAARFNSRGSDVGADAEIFHFLNKLERQPNLMWDLQDKPLEEVFPYLHTTSVMNHGEAGKVAFSVLLCRSDLEEYVARKIQQSIEVFVATEHEPSVDHTWHNNKFVDAGAAYRSFVTFAGSLPDDRALRLVGPALFVPDYLPSTDDFWHQTHAIWAVEQLSKLVKGRCGESIPNEIEGARNWWRANEHRFAAKPAPSPPVALAAAATPTPGSSFVSAVKSLSLNQVKSRYGLCGVIGSLVLVLLATLRARRKSK